MFHLATLARTEPLCASLPVWGQEETRSKFLWDVEGKQSKDALSSLPGAAIGQETEAEEG